MGDDPHGIFSRWSRRKSAARRGTVPADAQQDQAGQAPVPGRMITEPPACADREAGTACSGVSEAVTESQSGAEAAPSGSENAVGRQSKLTEDDFTDVDFDALDENSDYTPFMAKTVPEAIRRRALRKLWQSSPVFAQMDGLNDYDEDFTDGIEIVRNIATDYRIGRGFLSDKEVAEWEKLGADSKARALEEERCRNENKHEPVPPTGDIVVAVETPDQPRIAEFFEQSERYHNALYRADSNHFTPMEELLAPQVRFVVARDNGRSGTGARSEDDSSRGLIVGCGALVPGNDGAGEIKRMWVDRELRGRGIGRKILSALEEQARALNLSVIRLETGIKQADAIALYRKSGYVDCAPFGSYLPDQLSLFLEKPLKPPEPPGD